ncbi:MAG: hypothetical protein IJU51_01085 [Clostridia bacterium]|nr:hypothetical protein [Clostridia bacterium]
MISFRKILCVCVSAIMFMSLFTVSANADENESTGNELSERVSEIAVFGDSISAGYRLENFDRYDYSKAEDCFANILCSHYGLEYGKTFFNFSKTGDASDDTLDVLRSADKEIIKNSDVIIISTGGNDVMDVVELALYDAFKNESENFRKLGINIDLSSLGAIEKTLLSVFSDPNAKEPLDRIIKKCTDTTVQNSFSNTVLKYEENIKEMISYIRETGSEAQIYFLTPYDPTSLAGSNAIIDSIDNMLSNISAKTLSVAESKEYGYGTYVEDLFSEFKDNLLVWTNLITADIHPNKDGHRHIADMLITDITSVLSRMETSEQAQSEKSVPYSNTIIYILFGVACACSAAIIVHSIITYRKKT